MNKQEDEELKELINKELSGHLVARNSKMELVGTTINLLQVIKEAVYMMVLNQVISDKQAYKPSATEFFENYEDNYLASCKKTTELVFVFVEDILNNYFPNNYTYLNLFLQDRLMGHYFEMEDKTWLDYKRGDYTIIEPNKTHLVANLGYQQRFTMQITGYANAEDIQ